MQYIYIRDNKRKNYSEIYHKVLLFMKKYGNTRA